MWLLTNTRTPHEFKSQHRKIGEFDLFFQNKYETYFGRDIEFLLIDGYVLPRMEYFNHFKQMNQIELCKNLISLHSLDFIHYIKGIFTIILYKNNCLHIYCDRHSFSKYFTYEHDSRIIISNHLKQITKNNLIHVNAENAAIFAILSHFIDGSTLYSEITTNRPAEALQICGKKINRSKYWSPNSLFQNAIDPTQSIEKFSDKWQNLVNNYVEYLKPDEIGITLTGGNDSRMILAALLGKNKTINSFTYGDRCSLDNVIAEKIKVRTGINHEVYDNKEPTSEWLSDIADELIVHGNSLVNFHRSHRYDAAKKHYKEYPNTEMLFMGLAGGEYLKEPRINDITIPGIFMKLLSISKPEAINLLNTELFNRGIRTDNVDISEVYKKMLKFIDLCLETDDKKQKFLFTFMYYGCTHHTQDTAVYKNIYKFIVNPYMDVDFLDLISRTRYWYVNSKTTLIDQLFHSNFIVRITHLLSPQLSDIAYGKRGEYTANELLGNPFIYLLKRIINIFRHDRSTYPANFVIGNWLSVFINEKLININAEIEQLFNLTILEHNWKNIIADSPELEWHIITNPINLCLINDYYKNIISENSE